MSDLIVIKASCDPALDYHEWAIIQRVKADSQGRPNPRMYDEAWTLWSCNNTECPGRALVSDQAIQTLIERAQADG